MRWPCNCTLKGWEWADLFILAAMLTMCKFGTVYDGKHVEETGGAGRVGQHCGIAGEAEGETSSPLEVCCSGLLYAGCITKDISVLT